jgi:hypothetical protein
MVLLRVFVSLRLVMRVPVVAVAVRRVVRRRRGIRVRRSGAAARSGTGRTAGGKCGGEGGEDDKAESHTWSIGGGGDDWSSRRRSRR